MDFTRGIAAWWEERMGSDLLGVYLIGSLAHGGFNRRYSDIDMAEVAEAPLVDGVIGEMRTRVAELSSEQAAKLSLFWSDRTFSAGRFPPLDRMDYLDHAVPLAERERVDPARPTLGEVRSYLGAIRSPTGPGPRRVSPASPRSTRRTTSPICALTFIPRASSIAG